MNDPFITKEEAETGRRFLGEGYTILAVEDREALDRIARCLARLAAQKLGLEAPGDAGAFFDTIAERVTVEQLNDFRLAVIEGMNAEKWLRPAYYSLARNTLAAVAGNELVMQRRINLSIQLPGDVSSLLPVHADVWSGDSPFEVVVWLPLVDCHGTKSMYLLPPGPDAAIQERMQQFSGRSAEALFEAIEPDVVFLDVAYGQVLVFSQNLLHGNRVNREQEARWTMNCRFKGAFTPYADKKLGEFFAPITLRPATRLGLEYRLPGGWQDES